MVFWKDALAPVTSRVYSNSDIQLRNDALTASSPPWSILTLRKPAFGPCVERKEVTVLIGGFMLTNRNIHKCWLYSSAMRR